MNLFSYRDCKICVIILILTKIVKDSLFKKICQKTDITYVEYCFTHVITFEENLYRILYFSVKTKFIMKKFQCYMPIVNTVVVEDINICLIYRIKVVLLNNESMTSLTTMQTYQAPAGRKYISQV